MERIFNNFREASQTAAEICSQHGLTASLERRGGHWAVVFDGDVPNENTPNTKPDEIARLEASLCAANMYINQLRIEHSEANIRFSSTISVLAQEHELVKHLLNRQFAEAYFDEKSLNIMPKDNVEILLKYEYLCKLNDLGEIDSKAFLDFKAKSGLWIAIHNYEKIKAGPQPSHYPEHSKPVVEHCPSCGGAVLNGHCKCSD